MRASIVGCARNCERDLPGTLRVANEIATNFEECYYVFYENDSTDTTLSILQHFCAIDPAHRFVISEQNVPGHRESRLAHGRKASMKKGLTFNPQIVVVMDMDDVNSSVQNFDQALYLVTHGHLSVATANQYIQYYDLWALRTGYEPERCKHLPAAAQCDLFTDFNIPVKRALHKYTFKCVRNVIGSEQISKIPFTRVVSAFGGLAIYDAKKAEASVDSYSGVSHDQHEVCEHVPFHEHIVANGGSVGIVITFCNTGYDTAICNKVLLYMSITFIVVVCLIFV